MASNIANILLIGGLTCLVWPIRVAGATLGRDSAVMIAAALVLVPLFALAVIGRLPSAPLVAGLAAYVIWTCWDQGDETQDEADMPAPASMLVSG